MLAEILDNSESLLIRNLMYSDYSKILEPGVLSLALQLFCSYWSSWLSSYLARVPNNRGIDRVQRRMLMSRMRRHRLKMLTYSKSHNYVISISRSNHIQEFQLHDILCS